MNRAADVLEQHCEHLAALVTLEQGKPLSEAREEVIGSAMWMRYYAALSLDPEVVQDDEERRVEILRRPVGVVAAIAPWNYPLILAMWKIAPALRAGNTLVVKPSPYTPLATLELGRLLRTALPDGVLNVVSGPDPLGAAMSVHPIPRKVSFTGSTATGKKVAAAAADDLKRLTLELGGNDPAIVLADARVDEIAEPLFWSAFVNSGQVCLAVKRVYAHERIHDELVEALVALAASVRVDDGMADGVQMGPLTNEPQLRIVTRLVDEAVRRGGRALTGGSRIDRPGYFYGPTILTEVCDGFGVVDQEQFGPILPIVRISDEAEGLARANASPYGLTASIWSGDAEHASRLARGIEAGQVSINAHGAGVLPHLPFGGRKWSGLGVENGVWGLHGFTELQVISTPPRGRSR